MISTLPYDLAGSSGFMQAEHKHHDSTWTILSPYWRTECRILARALIYRGRRASVGNEMYCCKGPSVGQVSWTHMKRMRWLSGMSFTLLGKRTTSPQCQEVSRR